MSERVVVVTGAASGIGFATAERFRDLGDTVFGLDIAPTVPDGVTYVECNVGSKAAVDAAIKTCAASGRIDVLANVAGVVQFGRFEGVTEEVFDRTLDIDLKGPFFLMQAALPHLRAAGGNIVNVSSVAGRIPQPYSAAYSAAKGGLTQLTQALALELSPDGIRVNAVAPGPIWTPLNPMGGQPPENMDDFGEDTPMGRPGQSNEVAPAFLFLACEDSSYMSGQVLHPNGGIIVNG